MKKKLIITMGVLLIIVSTYLGLACYALKDSNIEELIVACLHPETNHYPKGLPEFYMLNYRGNKEDIDLLKSREGLSFVLNLDENPRDTILKYAAFFVEKGLNVNAIGMDGASPLHGSVIFNHYEDASFLLKNGADPTLRVGNNRLYGKEQQTALTDLTPLELAIRMSSKDGKDRSKIITLLKAAITKKT